MFFDNLLGDLLDAGFQSLSKKIKQDESNHDSVKLSVDHINEDTFVFCLYRCQDDYQWERKYWYRQDDISKITKPIDSLKYLGQIVIPNIIEQQGIANPEESKDIFSVANSLFTLNSNEKSGKIVVDGTEYLLQLKLGGIRKEFRWKVIPDSWTDVEMISNKIIELNNKSY